MPVRSKLMPAAALVLAIGASAAGAATAAATTSGGSAVSNGNNGSSTIGITSADKAQKPACTIDFNGGTVKAAGDKGPGQTVPPNAKGQIVFKSGQLPACQKKVAVIGLDTIAAKLGVSKPALVSALKATEQWVVTSKTKPSVAQFEQHLAGLLHVPAAKVAAVFGASRHFVFKNGA